MIGWQPGWSYKKCERTAWIACQIPDDSLHLQEGHLKERVQSWFSRISAETIAWLAAFIVLTISFLALTGQIFNVSFLMSIHSGWIAMSPITALCLILTAFQLILLLKYPSDIHQSIALWAPGIAAGLEALLLVALYALNGIHPWEPSLANAPFLYLLWVPGYRMAFLTAFQFVFCACALTLLATGNRRAAGIAHGLILPVMFLSYLVMISYVMGVQNLHSYRNVPVALNTGISFFALSLGILFASPNTWLMSVIMSKREGGVIARRFLPILLLIPILIGWVRIRGEQTGVFTSEVGVLLVAMTYTSCLLCLLWLNARSANRADQELWEANNSLDARLKERTQDLARAQAAAEAERQRLYNVLETLPAYVVLLTKDYQVPFANRFFRETFGESHGKRCFEFLFNRSEPCENCETYKVLKTKKPHHWEWTGPNSHNYDIYDFPFKDVDGTSHILEMGIDITAQKTAQAELEKHRDHLEDLVEERSKELKENAKKLTNLYQSMVEGLANHEIIYKDGKAVDYVITDVNPAFEKFTGITRESAAGRKASELYGTGTPPYLEMYAKVAAGGKPSYFETYFPPMEKHFAISVFSPEKGKFATVFNDITERKRAEETLQKTLAELEHSNKDLEMFAYAASHDLQAPLRHIENFSQLLQKSTSDRLNPKEITYHQRIQANSRRLSLLTQSLLNLSRISRREMRNETVDLSELAIEISNDLKAREPNRNMTFIAKKGLTAQGDAFLLRALLENLIGNAWKYTSKNKTAKIEFGSAHVDDQDAFFVKDDGAGFDKTYAKTLFIPFKRLHTDEEFEGSGIGLATAQRIVTRHNGLIWADAAVGKGATFYFTLPTEPKETDKNA
jgi:PAS domain S-box-containing protein